MSACGVCRTDLHVVDGELPNPHIPIIPGHEVVGRIDAIGVGVEDLHIGERVGIPWLGHTCGACPYCMMHRENLCDHPIFTGFTRDGGYATATIADARFAFPLGEAGSDVALAPLLCAGLIGWRSLVIAGDGKKLGLYGFGAAAHIVAQVATWQGRSVFAFTRPGDVTTQGFARSLGAEWAGGSEDYRPAGKFAGIVSVGALEHFTRPGLSAAEKVKIYRRFFERCRDWLNPGARLSLQCITWGNVPRDRTGPIMAQDVFPETDPPYVTDVLEASADTFEPLYMENSRSDYVRTLEVWLERLRARQPEIEAMTTDGIFEFYERYLRRSIYGFKRKQLQLCRFLFQRH